MNAAEAILAFIGIWGTIGCVVAALFLTFGIDRIDEDARGAYVFRVLLIPGVLVIWPLVLWRWAVIETGQDVWQRRYAPPRRIHFTVAFVLLGVVCLTLFTGLSLRQTWPADIAPERLSSAEITP